MYEEYNPPDIPMDYVVSTISKFFPQNRDLKITFHYHGTYNVYLVDERYIFRISSASIPADEAKKLILKEAKVLKKLREYLSFKIPCPEFIDIESKHPAMGYEMLPGESLSRCYDKTTVTQQIELAKQVAEFLGELHAPEMRMLFRDRNDFNPEKYRNEWQKVYVAVQERVYPHLQQASIKWIDGLFTDFLENRLNFQFTPRLIHGDFDTSNILVDSDAMKVTSIIDFEETRIYDPAVDFLFIGEGLVFLKTLLEEYPYGFDSGFHNRMIFQFGRQPLIYMLYGLQHDIKSMVTYGHSTLKHRISEWNKYQSLLDNAFSGLK